MRSSAHSTDPLRNGRHATGARRVPGAAQGRPAAPAPARAQPRGMPLRSRMTLSTESSLQTSASHWSSGMLAQPRARSSR